MNYGYEHLFVKNTITHCNVFRAFRAPMRNNMVWEHVGDRNHRRFKNVFLLVTDVHQHPPFVLVFAFLVMVEQPTDKWPLE